MELAGEIKDEFLTCNICLEGYTRPKQLPCLHTFCLKCLSRYITLTVGQSGVLSVPCPICRRCCVPPDPDPRKLGQWADQFPDNFFVASLRETVEARRKEEGEEREGGESRERGRAESSSRGRTTRYFMGQVTACSKHLTNTMTHFCLSVNAGVCETCLSEAPHTRCDPDLHLDSDNARVKATDLLKKYRDEMTQVKQNVTSVKRSFNRKPRLLQTKKEEVEICISDYYSSLRSSCAKLLLAKEKKTIEALNKVVDEESEKVSDSQKKCDDITTSMTHTMSLFDTLTHSGPFNAMHVLARAEQQIANISRLLAKMDHESKADGIQFQPPAQSFEQHLSRFAVGTIVTDFGEEEMGSAESNAQVPDTAAIADRLSRLEINSDQSSHIDEQGDVARNLHQQERGIGSVEGSDLHNLQDEAQDSSSVQNIESQLSELHLTEPSNSSTSLEIQSGGTTDSDLSRPSAPPLDDCDLPTYLAATDYSRQLPSPLPTAPPISAQEELYEQSYAESSEANASSGAYAQSYDTSAMSPAMAEAFLQSMRKGFSCHPLMVFSGNLPNESRRGGICGAAMMDQKNRAAFVDRHNHSLKIVDLHLAQVVGYLHLGTLEPWDITFMSTRNELVVTCPGSYYLLFVPSAAKRLEISYYIRLTHGYSCIAYLKDDLFSGGICAPFYGHPAVHVFDMKGTVIRQILPTGFSYPRTIFADNNGSLLVISDWTSNVVVIVTSEGELVCRYKEALSPKGVAMSGNSGLLHVIDGKWNRLHLLDNKGNCIGTGKVEGCRDARMVVVVPTKSSYFPDTELTVIADGNNALHIMSLAFGQSDISYDHAFSSAV